MLFIFVKLINKTKNKTVEKPAEVQMVTPEDILLLRDIKELLKEKNK